MINFTLIVGLLPADGGVSAALAVQVTAWPAWNQHGWHHVCRGRRVGKAVPLAPKKPKLEVSLSTWLVAPLSLLSQTRRRKRPGQPGRRWPWLNKWTMTCTKSRLSCWTWQPPSRSWRTSWRTQRAARTLWRLSELEGKLPDRLHIHSLLTLKCFLLEVLFLGSQIWLLYGG